MLRIKVKPAKSITIQESFTIELTDFKPDYSASLELKWENTTIMVPIMSTADGKIMAQIQENLLVKKVENAGLLNKGAQYYFTQNKDLNQALEWSKKSEALAGDNFNFSLLTSHIFGRLKRYPEAIKSAEKALELARKKDMTDDVKNLEEKIQEWKKVKSPSKKYNAK